MGGKQQPTAHATGRGLDLKMPRLSGLEFLEQLRQDRAHKHAVVLVLTTSKDEQDKLLAYDRHVAGYIVKSNVSTEFVEVIRLLDAYWCIIELPGGCDDAPAACAAPTAAASGAL